MIIRVNVRENRWGKAMNDYVSLRSQFRVVRSVTISA